MRVFSGYAAKHSFRILYISVDSEKMFNRLGMYIEVFSGFW